MKKHLILLALVMVLCGHDMYLKLDSYFLEPNTEARILLYNGTFDRSDNTIDRDRMIDASLVGNGERIRLYDTDWTEEGNVTILNFVTGEPGTWVAGVSTRPRSIEMDARAFNDYLEHDGVLDMLDWRRENDALDVAAVEKYSKHVKTIFQVGDELTSDWQTNLGYPIEFIPLENPYDLHTGHALQLQLLMDGDPLPDQLVYVGSVHADHDHDHDHDHEHEHDHGHSHDREAGGHDHDEESHSHEMQQYRTDANGRFSFEIAHGGVWYVRTIHLVESDEDGLTHESNWATLTFEVGEGHSHTHAHTHEHTADHNRISGFPGYIYWIGSFLVILLLFLIFNRRAK